MGIIKNIMGISPSSESADFKLIHMHHHGNPKTLVAQELIEIQGVVNWIG
jgi:hypothetical protein